MASRFPSTDDNLTVIGTGDNAQLTGDLTVIGMHIFTVKVDVDEIQKETVNTIDMFTKGTVEPASLEKILEKIQAGPICVITGSPGEGKSTLGYLALKHLQETRHVYEVSSPEVFYEVMKTCAPIILVDDIFGLTIFNEAAWGQWKGRIEQFINMNEHKPINEIGNLILIARDFVLKSGSRHAEEPWEMLINLRNTVNISSRVRENEEKIKILNAIANKYHVNLGSDTIETICSIETPHGFPHTCNLFVKLYKEDSSISATDFFNKPLEFLKNSLKILIMYDELIEHIFTEMIKGKGHVVRSELGKCGSKYITTANDLCPTYIKLDEDGYVFHHPSIMDTVAFLLCETKVSFVLDNCSMAFIRERVRLQTPDGRKREETEAPFKLIADIPWDDAGVLAGRFVNEIKAGDVLDLRFHNAWYSDMFVKMMIENMSEEQLNVRERKWGATLLHLLCRENRADCVMMCVQRGADVDRQNRIGWTSLHQAAVCGHTDCVCVLLEGGVNVNITDTVGRTGLDLSTQHQHSETVTVIQGAVGRHRKVWRKSGRYDVGLFIDQ